MDFSGKDSHFAVIYKKNRNPRLCLDWGLWFIIEFDTKCDKDTLQLSFIATEERESVAHMENSKSLYSYG